MKYDQFNQNIDCDVKSCAYCDYSCGKCMLASIKIKNEHKNASCANYKEKYKTDE